MAKPTVRVRVGFTDGPYVASPTWTDVTSYVRSISTRRGRSSDWDYFTAGTASVVLDNRDRRFDPTYTAGPYYGNLLPRRQIRIDATHNGSTYYDLFRGFVDGWPVDLTEANYDSTVTLQCFDVYGLLAQERLPYNFSANTVLGQSPSSFYQLDDFIDPGSIPTTTATLGNLRLLDSGSNNLPLSPTVASIPVQNTEPMAEGILTNTTVWPNDVAFTQAAGATGATTALTGVCFFRIATNTTTILWHQVMTIGGVQYTLRAEISSAGDLTVWQYRAGTSVTSWRATPTTALNLNPGVPHHFGVSVSTPTGTLDTITLLIDGVEIPMTRSSTTTTWATQTDNFRVFGAKQHVAYWLTANSATNIRSISRSATLSSQILTADAYTSALGNTSIPSAFYTGPTFEQTSGTVGPPDPGGQMVVDRLQEIADSEGGPMYVSRGGVLTMTARNWFTGTKQTVSQATFGAGGLPIQTEMSYAWDANDLRNRLQVQYKNDQSLTVSNSASITSYGVQESQIDTDLTTLADATDLGTRLVNFGATARLVFSAVTVGQALSSSEWATVLGLELLDRITVVIPQRVGSNLSQTQLIQAVEHNITPGDWRTTITGSARWTQVFILDSSLLDGDDLLA